MTQQATLPGQEAATRLLSAARQLIDGDFHPTSPADGNDDLAHTLYSLIRLEQLTGQISQGLLLEDILESIYQDFADVIPYDRIGLALIEDDGEMVRAYWANSKLPRIYLKAGYEAPLAGSSLQQIIETGQPRILNDLEDYLAKKPRSDSTRLIVDEGLRSSLTCPLVAEGKPVGFIFFSSIRANAYAGVHQETFKRIAGRLSLVVERGRLTSELLRQKETVEQQNEELKRLNALKNRLMGMVAHDLRNPLATIQMSAGMLLAEDLNAEETRTLLESVLRQSSHMMALLEDLVDTSSIEAGKLLVEPEWFDLPEFMRETVQRQDQKASAKGSSVRLQEVPEEQIMADRTRLRQVLDNLISNALKYSPPGSLVHVSARRTDNDWHFSVKDQGPGIVAGERHRLFKEFSRLSAQPTAGERSVGLGLAITRSIVEAHGGQIGVDSVAGSGSTFWFTLPNDLP